MIVRKATPDDINDIASLCIEQFQAMTALQPYFFQYGEQSKAFIQSVIEGDASDILVCELKNEIEGFVLLQAKETSDFPFIVQHKFAYLMDIIVRKNHQGNGYGKALLNEVKKWASERNLEYIELDVLTNNENAIQFYLKNNFEDKRKTMFCRL